jgi:rhamnosyltransferase
MPKLVASVLIPTRNAGTQFAETLKGVFAQQGISLEVLVLDTDSNDSTVETAKKFGCKIVGIIKQRQFGHGKARNLLAQSAKGKFLVFLTQDAVPANNQWLKNLLSGFKDKKIAGVYGRQLPKKGALTFEKMFYEKKYSLKEKTWNSENWSLENILFSNVNSAIPKELFLDNLFSEKTIVSEDYEWALRMMEKGYSIKYEPAAVVQHSHNLKIWPTFQKYFDIGHSYWQIFSNRPQRYKSNLIQEGIAFYYDLIIPRLWLLKQFNFLWLPYTILNGATKFFGVFAGKHFAHFLPRSVNKFFSSQKYFWEKK